MGIPAAMRHVVALSGGKDSTALALRLAEVEPREYDYICTPTGDELPDMLAHWERLECLLGKPLIRLGSGSLHDLIEQQQMIPNHRARFCTRILKIEPAIEYMESLPDGSVMYVGLRADESERRGLFGEDIAVRFPMREWGWGLSDVWRYLAERGVSIPKRTDCASCYHQRLGEWWELWREHPDRYERAAALERHFGHTFRSEERDTWPASLDDMRERFAAGEIPRGVELNYRLFEDEVCRACTL